MMSPKEEHVFAVVKSKVLDVLMDVDPVAVTLDRSLAELGANSVDRVEVAVLSMEALGLAIPPSELQGVKDLRNLVQVLCRHWGGPLA